MAVWFSGVILAQGARGPIFNSQNSPIITLEKKQKRLFPQLYGTSHAHHSNTHFAGRISTCISQALGGAVLNTFISHMQQPVLHSQARQLAFHYMWLALRWCPNSKCPIMFLYCLEHASLVSEGLRSLDSESKELTVTPQDQAPSITFNNHRKSP
jgi:hypothetical protein